MLLKICKEHSDIVIISGGLGPTDDDLTRKQLPVSLEKNLVKIDSLDYTSLRFPQIYQKMTRSSRTSKRQSCIPEVQYQLNPESEVLAGFITEAG